MQYQVFIKYFTLTFTAIVVVIGLTAAVFGGGSSIVPIQEDGVYVKGSYCLVNMEERHTDEYYLRYLFSQCLSAHAEFLYGETK